MRQNAARVSGIFLVLARNHWWADHRSRYANAARPANGQPPGKKAAAGWYWALLSGLVSILLGGMIIAQWPASGLWVIGLFVAIELIFNGWSYIFLALDARKSVQVQAEPA